MPNPEELADIEEPEKPKLEVTPPVSLDEIDHELVQKAREIQASGQRLKPDSPESKMLIQFLRTTGGLSGRSRRNYPNKRSREDVDDAAA